MGMYYCPSCARVYYVSTEHEYLCGRSHAPDVWPDGKVRRFVISEKTDTNKPPWPIPIMAEERELLSDKLTESWISPCEHPEDQEYGDVKRHFGFVGPGGKHLTKEEVLGKYASFVLKQVEK